MIKNKLTYISLFSSAGVGCFGFKQENYHCIATNELITKRMEIQKNNNKCEFESGYINEDITKQETKDKIYLEIDRWKQLGNDKVDVLIATPPCQGMSIANLLKKESDYNRNSLVVESIEIIKEINPRFFVFENVPAFLDTACKSPSGEPKAIKVVIEEELGNDYDIEYKTLNFKDYGSKGAGRRTLVIGSLKELNINPKNLFPKEQRDYTLREVIGDLKELSWGEIDENDFYHQFRTYPDRMRPWIENTKEGKSAFDNENPLHRPHKIVNGQIVFNHNKVSGKYSRLKWDKVCTCILTRNDALPAQYTIHPVQHRVLSIRELMLLMSIPNDFKWTKFTLDELNKLPIEEKQKILKTNEMLIRKSIGEAVPTIIFNQIAKNIKNNFTKNN